MWGSSEDSKIGNEPGADLIVVEDVLDELAFSLHPTACAEFFKTEETVATALRAHGQAIVRNRESAVHTKAASLAAAIPQTGRSARRFRRGASGCRSRFIGLLGYL
jgi:hypothetical protein